MAEQQLDPTTGLPINPQSGQPETKSTKQRDLTGLGAYAPVDDSLITSLRNPGTQTTTPTIHPGTGLPVLPGFDPYRTEGFMQGSIQEDYAPYTGLGINPAMQDVDELRAEEQPWYEQVGYGAVRLTTKAGTEVMKLPGVVAGVLGWAMDGFSMETFDENLNNRLVKGLDQLDQNIKSALPVHMTNSVKDGNILAKMGSTAWWGSTGADGIGFLLAMMAPGAAFKALKLGTGISRMIGQAPREFIQSASVANKWGGKALATKIDDYVGSFINTTYEAGIEAGSVTDQLKRQAYEKNGFQPLSPEEQQEIGRRGAGVFAANVAILTVPNYLQLKGMFGGAKAVNGDAMISRLINKETNKLVTELPKINRVGRAFKGLASGFVREGAFEEGFQWAAEQAAMDETSTDVGSYLANIFGSYIDGMSDSSSEWWEGVVLGGILGGGMNSFHAAQKANAENKGMAALHELMSKGLNSHEGELNKMFIRDSQTNELVLKEVTDAAGNTAKIPQLNWDYISSQYEEHKGMFKRAEMLDKAIERKDVQAVRDIFMLNDFINFAMPYLTTPGGLQALTNVIDGYDFGDSDIVEALGGTSSAQDYKQQLKDMAAQLQETYDTADNYGPDFFGVDITEEQKGLFTEEELKQYRDRFYEGQKRAAVIHQATEIYRQQETDKLAKRTAKFEEQAEKSAKETEALREQIRGSREGLSLLESEAKRAGEAASPYTAALDAKQNLARAKKELKVLEAKLRDAERKDAKLTAGKNILERRTRDLKKLSEKYLTEAEELYDKAKMQEEWEMYIKRQKGLDDFVKNANQKGESAVEAEKEYVERIKLALNSKGYDGEKIMQGEGYFTMEDKDGNLVIIRVKEGEFHYRIAPLELDLVKQERREAQAKQERPKMRKMSTKILKQLDPANPSNILSQQEAREWFKANKIVAKNILRLEALQSIMEDYETQKEAARIRRQKSQARLEKAKETLAFWMEGKEGVFAEDGQLMQEIQETEEEIKELEDEIKELNRVRSEAGAYIKALDEVRNELEEFIAKRTTSLFSFNQRLEKYLNDFLVVEENYKQEIEEEFQQPGLTNDLQALRAADEILSQDIASLQEMIDLHTDSLNVMWRYFEEKIPEFVAKYRYNGKFTPNELMAHLQAWIIRNTETARANKLLRDMPNPWDSPHEFGQWLFRNKPAYKIVKKAMAQFPLMSMDFINQIIMKEAEVRKLQANLAKLMDLQEKVRTSGKLVSSIETLIAAIPDIEAAYKSIKNSRARRFDKQLKKQAYYAGIEVEQVPIDNAEGVALDRRLRKADPYTTVTQILRTENGELMVDPETGMPYPTKTNYEQAKRWNDFTFSKRGSDTENLYVRFVNNKQLEALGETPPVEDEDALYAVVYNKETNEPEVVHDLASNKKNLIFTGIAKTETNFGENGLIDVRRMMMNDKAVVRTSKGGVTTGYTYKKQKFDTIEDLEKEYKKDKQKEYSNWRNNLVTKLNAGQRMYAAITGMSNGLPVRNMKAPKRAVSDVFEGEDFTILISPTLKNVDEDGYATLSFNGTSVLTYPGRVHVGLESSNSIVRVENRQLGEMGELGEHLMDSAIRLLAYGNEMENLADEVDISGTGFKRKVFPTGAEHGIINDIINFGPKNQKVDGKYVQNRDFEIFIVDNAGKGTREVVFRENGREKSIPLKKLYKVSRSGKITLNEASPELALLRRYLKTKYFNVSRKTLANKRINGEASDKAYFAIIDNINANSHVAYQSNQFETGLTYKQFVAKYALQTQIIDNTQDVPRMANRYYSFGAPTIAPPKKTAKATPKKEKGKKEKAKKGKSKPTKEAKTPQNYPIDSMAGKYFRNNDGAFLVMYKNPDTGEEYMMMVTMEMKDGNLVINKAIRTEAVDKAEVLKEIGELKSKQNERNGVAMLAKMATPFEGFTTVESRVAASEEQLTELAEAITTQLSPMESETADQAFSVVAGAAMQILHDKELAKKMVKDVSVATYVKNDNVDQQFTKKEAPKAEEPTPPKAPDVQPSSEATPEEQGEKKDECATDGKAATKQSFSKMSGSGRAANKFDNLGNVPI